MDRLSKQIEFIIEVDKVKKIIRKTKLFHLDRKENDAEHSWHICLMTCVLQEYSNVDIDTLKVLKMLLIHDLVEIDTDDKIVYSKTEEDHFKELAAAKRIFGLLPEDQGRELLDLWLEFEDRETPESRFANAVDRLEPVMQNIMDKGGTWREHGIHYEDIIRVNTKIGEGAAPLWTHFKAEIDRLKEEGLLA